MRGNSAKVQVVDSARTVELEQPDSTVAAIAVRKNFLRCRDMDILVRTAQAAVIGGGVASLCRLSNVTSQADREIARLLSAASRRLIRCKRFTAFGRSSASLPMYAGVQYRARDSPMASRNRRLSQARALIASRAIHLQVSMLSEVAHFRNRSSSSLSRTIERYESLSI
jgi:hypothetical protein